MKIQHETFARLVAQAWPPGNDELKLTKETQKQILADAGFNPATDDSVKSIFSRNKNRADVAARIQELREEARTIGQASIAPALIKSEQENTKGHGDLKEIKSGKAVLHLNVRQEGETVEVNGKKYSLSDPKDVLTLNMMRVLTLDKGQIESAKALLPFEHGKVADQGKKESQEEAAKKAASQGDLFSMLPAPGGPKARMVN